MRTINAPGVEWREIDKSGYAPAMTGTACWVPGFSDKGEPYKPMEFTNRTAVVNYYGEPDNEAERYFYAACCEVLNQNGRLWTCRLPYDNEAFEKMVGFKYSVTPNKNKKLSSDSNYSIISEQDSEIQDYATIETTSKPVTYKLSDIDEYRTNEKKVPAGTFLIVDTTGATYGKVTEDSRKGSNREVIGIVPIVTTAANALYAQSLINLACVSSVSSYEPIDGDYLKSLYFEDSKGNVLNNAGLSSVDVVKRLNTNNKWFFQKYEFINTTVCCDALVSDVNGLLSCNNKCSVLLTQDGETYTISTDVEISSALLRYQNSLNSFGGYLTSLSETDSFANTDTFKPILGQDPDDSEKNITCGWSGTLIGPKYQLKEGKQLSDLTAGTLLDNIEVIEVNKYVGIDGDDSIPTTMALDAGNYFSTIQPASDGNGFDPEHLKDIGVVVYKTYLDPSEGNKVSWEPVEAFCGSLYKDDKDPNTGVTKFIDTIINSQSQYINFFSNCFSSKAEKEWYLKTCDILISKPSIGAVLGFYESMTKEDISISKSIYDGLNKGMDKVKDLNLLDIDILCDAGIANIASYLKAIYGDKGFYDLTVTDDLGNSLLGMWKAVDPTNAAVKTWKTVEQKFDNFCKNVRKDCMFVADGLRPLVLQGDKKIIRDSKPANTIDANILPYLKTITGLNTSYCGLYMDWFEMADDYTGDFFWCPPSIKAMGIMINTDVNYNYWDAPAGLNRGRVAATDIAFSPTIQQAGSIYEKCINYAVNYPNDGIILEGQKTTQVKPSAFDRINVRRLFCRLERMVYKVSRYFVYEANTAYTRQRYVDAITPYFKECKLGGGCYDYKIICDESNNTADTIDRNELHVSIGIKPVKTIEFIMIDFVAASTGASWEEVL